MVSQVCSNQGLKYYHQIMLMHINTMYYYVTFTCWTSTTPRQGDDMSKTKNKQECLIYSNVIKKVEIK